MEYILEMKDIHKSFGTLVRRTMSIGLFLMEPATIITSEIIAVIASEKPASLALPSTLSVNSVEKMAREPTPPALRSKPFPQWSHWAVSSHRPFGWNST